MQTYAQRLADVAEELFGPEWPADLARFTETNGRTARRVRQAARDGQEYPAARGLLEALQGRLVAFVERLGRA